MSARYWIGLFVNTARFYARNRRPIAGVRALLRVLRGDNGEQCQICGRDYLRWRTSDEFYQQVHGSLPGPSVQRTSNVKPKPRGNASTGRQSETSPAPPLPEKERTDHDP